ncbi:MAG: hypothetical protein ABIK73_07865 [candidate division WOR-3 bacterium]
METGGDERVRKRFAPLIILIFISLLSLPVVLSQSEPVDPVKPPNHTIESVSWSYPSNYVIYNFTSIYVSFTLNRPSSDSVYVEIMPTKLFVCHGFPDTTFWVCEYWYSFFIRYKSYVSGTTWYFRFEIVDYGNVVDPYEGIIVSRTFTLSGSQAVIETNVTVVGYVAEPQGMDTVYIYTYLHYDIVINGNLAASSDPYYPFSIENTYETTDPGFYIKERYVETKITYSSGLAWITDLHGKIKYYVPQQTPPPETTTPPPETTPPSETTPETPPPENPPPEEPLETITNYYDSPPLVKMTISDAIRLGFYLYHKPTGVSDKLVIYHYLTMRKFEFNLPGEKEYYLLTLTDAGETQKHRMILYDYTEGKVVSEYVFRSMDHFTITNIKGRGSQEFIFYRSRFGRSLVVREEKLINLGNEFIMYPLTHGLQPYFLVDSSVDQIDLTIYIPYRFGVNLEREDYYIRIPAMRFYTSNNNLTLVISRYNETTGVYEYSTLFSDRGVFDILILFLSPTGRYLNETKVYINDTLILWAKLLEPQPYIGDYIGSNPFGYVSEILLELECKFRNPNTYIHFIVTTSTAYRIETTQFTLLPLKDFIQRTGYNETHFRMYLELWMRPVYTIEVSRGNKTVYVWRYHLQVREGNCTFPLTHVYYDPSIGLYKSSVGPPRHCETVPPPAWTRGFESMVMQVEKRGYTFTIYSPAGRRDYSYELVLPNTDEFRTYTYQGYFSAFIITNCIDVLQYSSSKRMRIEPKFVNISSPTVEKVEIPRLELPDWWNLPGWLSFIGNLLYTYLTIIINLLTTLFSAGVVLIPSLLKMFGVLYVVAVAGLSLYNPSKLVTMHVEIFFLLEKLLKRLWEALVSFAKLIASIISALKPI